MPTLINEDGSKVTYEPPPEPKHNPRDYGFAVFVLILFGLFIVQRCT
jgi:hypothetical protein